MADGPAPAVSRYYTGQASRPDFVMVGLPRADGVELWASTELSYAELEAETRFRQYADYDLGELFASPWYPPPEPVSRQVTLRAGLGKFVIVRAPTYREALAALLARDDWSPRRAELEPGS